MGWLRDSRATEGNSGLLLDCKSISVARVSDVRLSWVDVRCNVLKASGMSRTLSDSATIAGRWISQFS